MTQFSVSRGPVPTTRSTRPPTCRSIAAPSASVPRPGRFAAVAGRNAARAATLLISAVLPAIALAQGSPVKGDPAKARDKVAMCIGCHGIGGYKASFPEVYSVPMIAGQSERYLVAALEAYRKGDRPHPSMRAIAGSLSDQDIADLAAYYAAGGATAIGRAK